MARTGFGGPCQCTNPLAWGSPSCQFQCPVGWPSIALTVCDSGVNGTGFICSSPLYSPIGGDILNGCDCANATSQYGFSCTPCNCAEGEYCDPGVAGTGCHPCAPATHGHYSVANECVNCEPGKYNPDSGASSCTACSLGSYSAGASTGCTTCSGATYAPITGLSACWSCDPPLAVEPPYPVSCHGCVDALAFGGNCTLACNDTACTSGPMPGACDSGRESGTGCVCSGNTVLANDSSCVCAPGYHSSDCSLHCMCSSTREYCSDGFTGTGCVICPPGTLVVGKSCVSCAAGRYQAGAMTSCAACAAGRFRAGPGGTTCHQCAAGRYASATGTTACTDCAADVAYQVSVGSTECDDCLPPLRAQDTVTCSACADPGGFGTACAAVCNTTCTASPSLGTCDAGFEASAGCFDCPGHAQALGDPPTGPCLCSAGWYGTGCDGNCSACFESNGRCDDGKLGGCTPCQSGYVTAGTTNAACTVCAAGSYQSGTTCHACSPGRYQPSSNTTACIDCAPGYVQPASGSTSCTACTAGRYQSPDSVTACADCSPGSFQPLANATSCTACVPGQYQDVAQATACKDCTVGRYQPLANTTACLACSPGHYQANNASTACADCSLGHYQPNSTATVCFSCTPGLFQPLSAAASCEVCAPGTYQPLLNASGCWACEPGSMQAAWGATVCAVCTAGRYQPSTNQTQCLGCAVGRFQASSNATQCTACAVGRYQPSTNGTLCAVCSPGTYQASTGTTACAACAPGLYQPFAGATSCLNCPVGVNSSNALACDTCVDSQTYGSDCEQTCADCSVGSWCYPGYTGAGCLPCPAGSVDIDGFCTLCAAGRYQRGNDTFCSACYPGGTSLAGNTSCTACGARFQSSGGLVCDLCLDPLDYGPACNVSCLNCTSGLALCEGGSPGAGGCSAPPAWPLPPTISLLNDSAKLTQIVVRFEIDLPGLANLTAFSHALQHEIITLTGASFTPVINSMETGSLLVNVTLGLTAAQVLQQFAASFLAHSVSLDPNVFPIFTHFASLTAPDVTLAAHLVPFELAYDTSCGAASNGNVSFCASISASARPFFPARCYAGLCGCVASSNLTFACDPRTQSVWVDPEQAVCVAGAALGVGDVCANLLSTAHHLEYYVTRRAPVYDQVDVFTLNLTTLQPANGTVLPLPSLVVNTTAVEDGWGEDECGRRSGGLYVNWFPRRRFCRHRSLAFAPGLDPTNVQVVLGDPFSANSSLLSYTFGSLLSSNLDFYDTPVPVVRRGYLRNLFQGAPPLLNQAWAQIEYAYLYSASSSGGTVVLQALRSTILDSQEGEPSRFWRNGSWLVQNCTLLGYGGAEQWLAYASWDAHANRTRCDCSLWHQLDPASSMCVPGCLGGAFGLECELVATAETCTWAWNAATMLFMRGADCTPVCRAGHALSLAAADCVLVPLAAAALTSNSVTDAATWGLIGAAAGVGALALLGLAYAYRASIQGAAHALGRSVFKWRMGASTGDADRLVAAPSVGHRGKRMPPHTSRSRSSSRSRRV